MTTPYKRLLVSLSFLSTLALPIFQARAGVPAITSIKATGPNTITVVYSEPVNANAGDYSNFTGLLGGRSVASLGGSGGSTITLSLNGEPLSASAAGYVTVGTNTTSVSTRSPFPGGVFTVADAQAPSLISLSIAAADGTRAIGRMSTTFTMSFSLNEPASSISASVMGHTLPLVGSGAGPYTITYTVAAGDTEGVIPVSLAYTDTAGNTGRSSFTLNSGASSAAVAATNVITSNANSSGVLKIGDSIQFTYTPSVMQPNARVNGSYNGVPLSWYTTNGGVSYTATYVVAAGHTDQPYPVQITGVVLTDQFGTASAAVSGSDIAKTIVATSPSIYEMTPVATPSTNATPRYSFYSNKAGSIRYGGSCSSQSTYASAGANTITFNQLPSGSYTNCTISVIDAAGNSSNQITVSGFVIGDGATATPAEPAPTTSTPTAQSLAAQLAALQSQLSAAQNGGASAGAKYQFTKALALGASGTEVLELQKRLKAEGYLSATPNGNYGPATKAAVQAFQRANGLSPLGTVGPGTRAALNR
jgi:hypothetical protein